MRCTRSRRASSVSTGTRSTRRASVSAREPTDSPARARRATEIRHGEPWRAGVEGRRDRWRCRRSHDRADDRCSARRHRRPTRTGGRLDRVHAGPAGPTRSRCGDDPGVDGGDHEGGRSLPSWRFWRERGLAGSAISHAGPMRELHDMSGPDGAPPALFGFVPGGSAPVIVQDVVDQLVAIFGPEAAAPTDITIPGLADRAVDVATERGPPGRLPDLRPRGVRRAGVGRPPALVLDRDGPRRPRPHRRRPRCSRARRSSASSAAPLIPCPLRRALRSDQVYFERLRSWNADTQRNNPKMIR